MFRLAKPQVAALLGSIPERRLLSKRALAEHFGVMPRTVKTCREKGCPALRVGRVLMFDVHKVNRWLEREAEA
jgi:phage terminase Nu1 subunit (DNA packaging protein)